MRHHRTLILICHGKTERDWDGDDLARPLRGSAKRAAQKFGAYLLEHDIDCPFLASPAVRTRISAEKAAKTCNRPVQRIQYNKWLYRPGLPEQLDILSRHLMRNDLIYFGHAAALQDLLLHLVGSTVAGDFGLGRLAKLSIELDTQAGRVADADLELMLSDTDLPDSFPYPVPGAAERRPRPAYYYTQSGVVPYQLTDTGARILLITSQKRQRWGVPKGICEPGLSPQVSAAKEALEEAGISGPVSDHALGRYAVSKWGAVCYVQLHAMRVEEELSNGEWADNGRMRAWHAAESAADHVYHPQLSSLISGFSKSLSYRG
ncbi:NUDIX domain-containing protein [Epibacterium ulvae]|uniref:NUDIX domain-containing protein n=1 Tax=Epibacterium ulvae TaxID=1156985 RepID=UPI001BFC43F1|nr:NUDIX domain-containing protein [Epibacterium ulvae]MBT8153203.1 NUDIX domain-containing protein [Epibacterium ulvae]